MEEIERIIPKLSLEKNLRNDIFEVGIYVGAYTRSGLGGRLQDKKETLSSDYPTVDGSTGGLVLGMEF